MKSTAMHTRSSKPTRKQPARRAKTATKVRRKDQQQLNRAAAATRTGTSGYKRKATKPLLSSRSSSSSTSKPSAKAPNKRQKTGTAGLTTPSFTALPGTHSMPSAISSQLSSLHGHTMITRDSDGDEMVTATRKAGGGGGRAKMTFSPSPFKFDQSRFETHTEGIFSRKHLSSLPKFEAAASSLDPHKGTATFAMFGKLPMCSNCQAGLLTRDYHRAITAKYPNIKFKYTAREPSQLPGNLRKAKASRAKTTHQRKIKKMIHKRTIEHSYPKR